MTLDDYLTAHEAAEQLGISYHKLMRARARGLVQADKKGWQFFFRKDEVERFRMFMVEEAKLIKDTGAA